MYRVEDKYIIGRGEYELLKRRLKTTMSKDAFCKEKNQYIITSIYFDDLRHTMLMDSEEGISERHKYRLRFYNNDFSFIRLEKKMKKYNRIKKVSLSITKEQMYDLLNGNTVYGTYNNLLDEFNIYVNTKLLKPVIAISYERMAFVNETGNVRITFDDNIMYSKDTIDIQEMGIIRTNHYWKELKQGIVMEVKYDELLPNHIAQLLESNNLIQTSFSKYKECMLDKYW